MRVPRCDICREPLADWVGNIMVPLYFRAKPINVVHVWCKACTREEDNLGRGEKFHAIWELGSLKETPLSILWSIVRDMQTSRGDLSPKWTEAAVNRIGRLLSIADPASSGGFLPGTYESSDAEDDADAAGESDIPRWYPPEEPEA